jgi:hypothetical protein
MQHRAHVVEAAPGIGLGWALVDLVEEGLFGRALGQAIEHLVDQLLPA